MNISKETTLKYGRKEIKNTRRASETAPIIYIKIQIVKGATNGGS